MRWHTTTRCIRSSCSSRPWRSWAHANVVAACTMRRIHAGVHARDGRRAGAPIELPSRTEELKLPTTAGAAVEGQHLEVSACARTPAVGCTLSRAPGGAMSSGYDAAAGRRSSKAALHSRCPRPSLLHSLRHRSTAASWPPRQPDKVYQHVPPHLTAHMPLLLRLSPKLASQCIFLGFSRNAAMPLLFSYTFDAALHFELQTWRCDTGGGRPLRLFSTAPLFVNADFAAGSAMGALLDGTAVRVVLMEPPDARFAVVTGYLAEAGCRGPIQFNVTIVPGTGDAVSARYGGACVAAAATATVVSASGTAAVESPSDGDDVDSDGGIGPAALHASNSIGGGPGAAHVNAAHFAYAVSAPFPRPSIMGLEAVEGPVAAEPSSAAGPVRAAESTVYRLVLNCGDAIRVVTFRVRCAGDNRSINSARTGEVTPRDKWPMTPCEPVAGSQQALDWWTNHTLAAQSGTVATFGDPATARAFAAAVYGAATECPSRSIDDTAHAQATSMWAPPRHVDYMATPATAHYNCVRPPLPHSLLRTNSNGYDVAPVSVLARLPPCDARSALGSIALLACCSIDLERVLMLTLRGAVINYDARLVMLRQDCDADDVVPAPTAPAASAAVDDNVDHCGGDETRSTSAGGPYNVGRASSHSRMTAIVALLVDHRLAGAASQLGAPSSQGLTTVGSEVPPVPTAAVASAGVAVAVADGLGGSEQQVAAAEPDAFVGQRGAAESATVARIGGLRPANSSFVGEAHRRSRCYGASALANAKSNASRSAAVTGAISRSSEADAWSDVLSDAAAKAGAMPPVDGGASTITSRSDSQLSSASSSTPSPDGRDADDGESAAVEGSSRCVNVPATAAVTASPIDDFSFEACLDADAKPRTSTSDAGAAPRPLQPMASSDAGAAPRPLQPMASLQADDAYTDEQRLRARGTKRPALIIANVAPLVRVQLVIAIDVAQGTIRVLRLARAPPRHQPAFDGERGDGVAALARLTSALVASLRQSICPSFFRAPAAPVAPQGESAMQRRGANSVRRPPAVYPWARELNNDALLAGASLPQLVCPTLPLAIVGWGE